MAAYDIDPPGVAGVLGQADGVAGGFDTEGGAFETGVGGAGGEAGSAVVSGSLEGFVGAQVGQVGAVVTRTGSCLTGAREATDAYVRGDLEMAANAQEAASAAPDPTAIMPGRGGGGPVPQ